MQSARVVIYFFLSKCQCSSNWLYIERGTWALSPHRLAQAKPPTMLAKVITIVRANYEYIDIIYTIFVRQQTYIQRLCYFNASELTWFSRALATGQQACSLSDLGSEALTDRPEALYCARPTHFDHARAAEKCRARIACAGPAWFTLEAPPTRSRLFVRMRITALALCALAPNGNDIHWRSSGDSHKPQIANYNKSMQVDWLPIRVVVD